MRNLLIATLIGLASLGAQAQSKMHLSDLQDLLASDNETYANGFLAGVIMMELNYPDQVCGGRTVVGAARAQVSADLRNYLEKYPSKDIAIEMTDAPKIILGLLKVDYPCGK